MSNNKCLTSTIIDYSCEIKNHHHVIIEMTGYNAKPFVDVLVKAIQEVGASVSVLNKSETVLNEFLMQSDGDNIKSLAHQELTKLKQTDVYIMVKSLECTDGLMEVPQETIAFYNEHYIKPIHAYVLNQTRWLSIRYPNKAMAENAHMSLEAFADYYYKVCTIDYSELSKAMDVLVKMMSKTQKVHITGRGTDVEFSIKNMPVHKCDGLINLPDGEVYTAPIKTSVNGFVTYNVASRYKGRDFETVKLTFKEGKIVDFEGTNKEALSEIFNTDEGAKYIGEFALGVNPYLTTPIKDILFDEKISGSFHLTPGFAYANANNGNASAIHWDLVCIQTPAYGGGEIYFDNMLIRQNGDFVDDRLKILNPIK